MITQGKKIAIIALVVAAIIGLILLISKKEKNKKKSCEKDDDCGTNETCAEKVCICPDTTFTVYDGKCYENCDSPQKKFPGCTECVNPDLKFPGCTECVNPDLKAPGCTECVDDNLKAPNCNTCVDDNLKAPNCTDCVDGKCKSSDGNCIANECTQDSCEQGESCNTGVCPNKCQQVDCSLSTACQFSKTGLKTLIAAALKSSPGNIPAANAIIDKFVNDDCCNPAADKKYCLCPDAGCSVIFDDLKELGIDLEDLAPKRCNRTFPTCCKLTV